MSNYRVRQVLALGHIPERHLRLLAALATFMPDDTRVVRVGLELLAITSGMSLNTVRKARDELSEMKWLEYRAGVGAGNLSEWVVRCLPAKGTNVVGTLPAAKKVPTEPEKRYQPKPADQPQQVHWLIPLAKTSTLASFVIEEVRKHTGKTITTEDAERGIKTKLEGRPVRNAQPWLRKVIWSDPEWWLPTPMPPRFRNGQFVDDETHTFSTGLAPTGTGG